MTYHLNLTTPLRTQCLGYSISPKSTANSLYWRSPGSQEPQRPLQIEELQHAVTVRRGDKDIEDGVLAEPALTVSVCAGLVTIDAESRNF
jgi:hypothetical protein